ncbi:MAG: NAD-dependent epimerase/dehydratase family protein [Bacteroidota bacterium]
MKKIAVIGGAGYLGSHIVSHCLNQGFQVKTSVTKLSLPEKYQHLQNLPNSANLEIVELDLTKPSGFMSYLEGVDIVIHSGTPFKLAIDDPVEELFKPTIEGTKSFLEIASKLKSLQKIIFVASVSSYNTNFPMPPGDYDPGELIDENRKPFFDEQSHPYAQAKFLANQVVNDFLKEFPIMAEKVVSVSPVSIMGPALSGRKDSESVILQSILREKSVPNPFYEMLYNTNPYLAMVDVRDVAKVVVNLAVQEEADFWGKNYILSAGSHKILDVVEMLNKRKPEERGSTIYSSQNIKKELGISFRSIVETLGDF